MNCQQHLNQPGLLNKKGACWNECGQQQQHQQQPKLPLNLNLTGNRPSQSCIDDVGRRLQKALFSKYGPNGIPCPIEQRSCCAAASQPQSSSCPQKSLCAAPQQCPIPRGSCCPNPSPTCPGKSMCAESPACCNNQTPANCPDQPVMEASCSKSCMEMRLPQLVPLPIPKPTYTSHASCPPSLLNKNCMPPPSQPSCQPMPLYKKPPLPPPPPSLLNYQCSKKTTTRRGCPFMENEQERFQCPGDPGVCPSNDPPVSQCPGVSDTCPPNDPPVWQCPGASAACPSYDAPVSQCRGSDPPCPSMIQDTATFHCPGARPSTTKDTATFECPGVSGARPSTTKDTATFECPGVFGARPSITNNPPISQCPGAATAPCASMTTNPATFECPGVSGARPSITQEVPTPQCPGTRPSVTKEPPVFQCPGATGQPRTATTNAHPVSQSEGIINQRQSLQKNPNITSMPCMNSQPPRPSKLIPLPEPKRSSTAPACPHAQLTSIPESSASRSSINPCGQASAVNLASRPSQQTVTLHPYCGEVSASLRAVSSKAEDITPSQVPPEETINACSQQSEDPCPAEEPPPPACPAECPAEEPCPETPTCPEPPAKPCPTAEELAKRCSGKIVSGNSERFKPEENKPKPPPPPPPPPARPLIAMSEEDEGCDCPGYYPSIGLFDVSWLQFFQFLQADGGWSCHEERVEVKSVPSDQHF